MSSARAFFFDPRGFAPRTFWHALSRAASTARSVRVAHFAALVRVVLPSVSFTTPASLNVWSERLRPSVLTAAVNSTIVAGQNLTVGSTVWLPAESLAPGRW